ncbi:MAG: glutamate--cysteine ligase [Cyanobacteria bacterium P01_H01_bin.15]
MLLSKGFEVEIYTGKLTGEIVGLSDRIIRDLDGFVREPDSRNVEYTTAPFCRYERLLCALLAPRRLLRNYLHQLGEYTLIPGSTLSLGGSDRFCRSDPNNPYHNFIEKSYGTTVVTASVHINLGIQDSEMLMRACRLVRAEACLYLALSAASPFLDGKATGYHSTRWHLFPETPSRVPLFHSHQHYIDWTHEQLSAGTMQNVRHLWIAVRPNGDRRPYCLNRLELRICDLIADPLVLLAVTALLEARLWQLFAHPDALDPLSQSSLTPEELLDLIAKNESAAAHKSLDATLYHWQDGRPLTARKWLENLYETVFPFANARGFASALAPLLKVLQTGNVAQQWLRQNRLGLTPSQILTTAITQLARQENELSEKLCRQAESLLAV